MKIGDTRRKLSKWNTDSEFYPIIGEKPDKEKDERESFDPAQCCSHVVQVHKLVSNGSSAVWCFSHYDKPTEEELRPIREKIQQEKDSRELRERKELERKRTHWFFGLIPRLKPLSNMPAARALKAKE